MTHSLLVVLNEATYKWS